MPCPRLPCCALSRHYIGKLSSTGVQMCLAISPSLGIAAVISTVACAPPLAAASCACSSHASNWTALPHCCPPSVCIAAHQNHVSVAMCAKACSGCSLRQGQERCTYACRRQLAPVCGVLAAQAHHAGLVGECPHSSDLFRLSWSLHECSGKLAAAVTVFPWYCAACCTLPTPCQVSASCLRGAAVRLMSSRRCC